MLPASLYVGKFNKLREIIPRQMHICVCVCVCAHSVAAWPEPCASKEQVWGGSPALPNAHLRGRLCAACALSVPTPHRAGEPGGERGVRRGERGLKGINHGRERRAGGRRMEGCGGEGGWLAAHVHPLLLPPLSLCLVSFIFYLCLCWWAVMYREGGRGRHRQSSLLSCLFSG